MSSKFFVGQSLTTRSICNQEVIFKAMVIQRTKKTITFLELGGITPQQPVKVKIHQGNGFEYFFPLGKYSMAPVFKSNTNHLWVEILSGTGTSTF